MSENTTTAELLDQLKAMITDARPVPMSASCMVNRAEALALVERAAQALPAELDDAKKVIEASRDQVLRGKDEGDRIRIEAEEWAAKMASQTEIARLAQKQADQMIADAKAETEALRAETDMYVDTHMAEFEAALARTASQVRTVRAKLAQRAPEPEVEAEPEALPES